MNAVEEEGNNTPVQSSMKQFLLFPSSHHYIAICCRFRLTPTLVASFFCILYPELSISLLASSTVVGIRKLAQLVFYDHLPSILVTCYLVRRLMNFPRKKTIFKAQKSRFRRLNMQSETPLVFYEDLRVHYFKRTNAF